jgi:hypothetical protein
VHLVAILQPTLMYCLMAAIMVVPTMEMCVVQPTTQLGQDFLAAMEQIKSPIGPDYINPILVTQSDPGAKQVIEITDIDGTPTALQHYVILTATWSKTFGTVWLQSC